MLIKKDTDKVYTTAFDLLTDLKEEKVEITLDLVQKAVRKAVETRRIKNFKFESRVIIDLQAAFTIKTSTSRTLIDFDENHEEWYFDDQKVNRPYWESYRKFLLRNKRYSIGGVNSMNEDTDKIMNFLEEEG